jgi:hypothetical protein
MATRLIDAQKKIFEALNNNTEIIAIVTGVFDYVPEDVVTPYITFGQMLSSEDKTKTDDGEKINVFIEIWSENQGRKEALEILTLAEKSLETEFVFTDADVLEQKTINREVVEETYGVFHATLEFQIRLAWN